MGTSCNSWKAICAHNSSMQPKASGKGTTGLGVPRIQAWAKSQHPETTTRNPSPCHLCEILPQFTPGTAVVGKRDSLTRLSGASGRARWSCSATGAGRDAPRLPLWVVAAELVVEAAHPCPPRQTARWRTLSEKTGMTKCANRVWKGGIENSRGGYLVSRLPR
ncbi:hypothetical protein PspLS_11026 [Pyricularia sp. CBS 133598]|nr:hypothetical protein PspLS_11026 [Pyricularia sp. CBS 133598]